MNSGKESNIPDVNKIIDSALYAAVTVLHLGGSTTMADRAFRNVVYNSKVNDLSIMWRLDNVIVNYTDNGQSKTILKSVGSVGTSLTAVSKIIELTEDIRNKKAEVTRIDDGINEILKAPPVHSHLTYILVAGLAAAFYSLFHHGSIESVIAVFTSAVVGQTLRLHLQAREMRDSHITFICGLLSASIASIFLHLGYGQVEIQTLIACLIYLVPGLLMINGFVDFTKQRYIFIGLQRMLNASFIFLILALVILIAYTFVKIY